MIKENFIKLYENSFKENWDLPCYTDYGEDNTFTYGQVAEEIAKLHLLFQHCSLRRGDKISIIGKNTSRWCIAYMATITYGANGSPLPPTPMEPSLCPFFKISSRMTFIILSIIPNPLSCLSVIIYGKTWKKKHWATCVQSFH